MPAQARSVKARRGRRQGVYRVRWEAHRAGPAQRGGRLATGDVRNARAAREPGLADSPRGGNQGERVGGLPETFIAGGACGTNERAPSHRRPKRWSGPVRQGGEEALSLAPYEVPAGRSRVRTVSRLHLQPQAILTYSSIITRGGHPPYPLTCTRPSGQGYIWPPQPRPRKHGVGRLATRRNLEHRQRPPC